MRRASYQAPDTRRWHIPTLLAFSVVVAFLIGALCAAAYLVLTSNRCELEDSTNCYWNAKQQGNGEGQSFIDINGSTIYLP